MTLASRHLVYNWQPNHIICPQLALNSVMAIRVGGYTDIGRKLENQDTFNMYRIKAGDVYVGVLDGHGSNGKSIARRAKELLLQNLKDSTDYPANKAAALRSACIRTHKAIAEGSIDCTLSGTTATVALISRSHRLNLAWLGDSRAVVGRLDSKGRVSCVALTSDHNCDDPKEAERIRRMGGKVEPYLSSGRYVGPNRLWNRGRMQRVPGLCVSRSIGDTVAHTIGCSADPQLLDLTLTDKDKFLIIASDGVWDGLSNQEAVNIVSHYKDPTPAAKALVKAAIAGMELKHMDDNATAVIVYFK